MILRLALSLGLCALFAAPSAMAYPLTEAQEERIRLFLPKAYEKLKRREPVHVAIVGDGVSQMITYDKDRFNILLSMHGHFLRGLEAEFYYTGGLQLINPIGENPRKLNDHIGPEITVQHFTQPATTAISAVQMLTTHVFINQPDIVLISFGQGDLRSSVRLDAYERALKAAVQLTKDNGSEPIIVGPTPIRDPQAPVGWGATRKYVRVAREVANDANVMFVDPGRALLQTKGAPADGTTEERSRFVSETLAQKYFEYGSEHPNPETIFMNSVAHEVAGRGMIEHFLDGDPETPYEVTAEAVMPSADQLKIEVDISNTTEEPKRGVITAMNIGRGWTPTSPYHAFKLEKESSEQVTFEYQRRVLSQNDESTTYFPLVGNGRSLTCSLLVSDEDETAVYDAVAPILPVAVVWDLKALENQTGVFPLKFSLHNPGNAEVSGTYHLTYATQQARGAFRLGSREAREFEAKTKLPAGDAMRSKHKARLVIEAGNASFVSEREVEVTRNLSLSKPISLSRADRYTPDSSEAAGGSESVDLMLEADGSGLTATFDIKGIGFEEADQKSPVMLDFAMDARPTEEVRSFGYVAPITISAGPDGGSGKTEPIKVSAFGNGYDKLLDATGITSTLINGDDGKTHELIVKIPRVYLYRHEWNLGSGVIGFGAKLQFLRVDTGTGAFGYPAKSRWVTNESGLHPNDAAWLSTLELKAQPSDRWSVRIY
ncbi:MAG: SGNH/GDSL hydrolase family protein [Verrucomicrobiota bacterium]